MKAWELQNFGISHLKRVERVVPKPGPKQILVKVSAVSLNFRDKAIVDGIYLPHLMKMPIVPVSDLAGVVAEIGSEISEFQIGDRVISHVYPTWITGLRHPANVSEFAIGGPVDGGLAEYILLEETGAVKSPTNLTDQEAATLPIAALTAWFSLTEHGRLKPGDTIVTQGTGGVSLFAVQLASALGARIISLSSSEDKLEYLKQLGSTDLINYREFPDWHKEVLALTNGVGADNVIDIAGGRSLNKSITAIRDGGQVSVIGFLDGITSEIELLPVVFKSVQIKGILVGNHEALKSLVIFIEQHKIKPVVDKVYAFDDALEAYKHLERGPLGKIVISLD